MLDLIGIDAIDALNTQLGVNSEAGVGVGDNGGTAERVVDFSTVDRLSLTDAECAEVAAGSYGTFKVCSQFKPSLLINGGSDLIRIEADRVENSFVFEPPHKLIKSEIGVAGAPLPPCLLKHTSGDLTNRDHSPVISD